MNTITKANDSQNHSDTPLPFKYDSESMSGLTIEEIVSKMGTYSELRGFLKDFTGPLIEKMLQGEMDTHLGYKKHDKKGYNTGNSRNGAYSKSILTEAWVTQIEVPRDRSGEFEPKIMPKFQTRTLEIEDKIINMYGLGLTTRDIQAHLRDIYGADISADLVSNITNTILPFIAEWQGRVLESFYPIIYLDAIHFKVRENAKVESRGTYFVVGIDATGHKDVLGFYIGDAESSSFWQQVCNNLASRGVQDVCIACIDGLAGFATAIRNIFPSVIIQRCVIHQIRYSMQYVSSKDSKEFMTDLKSIYRATTLEIAEEYLDRLESKWENIKNSV